MLIIYVLALCAGLVQGQITVVDPDGDEPKNNRRDFSKMSKKRLERIKRKKIAAQKEANLQKTTSASKTSRADSTRAAKEAVKSYERKDKISTKYIGSIVERLEGGSVTDFKEKTMQHCFSCEVEVIPHHRSGIDVWKKCIENGALMECYGLDKACETVERRYNKEPYYVRMGCKQQASCVQNIPDWRFNSGECRPEEDGNSYCYACCDNTKQAQSRACNLDTYLDKKKGQRTFWNQTHDIANPH